ncbi:MAG: hypothetical protein ABI651_10500 [Verrucomicrobiota bacterium]
MNRGHEPLEVGTARCAVRAASSGATVPPAATRAGTSQRDVPTKFRFMESFFLLFFEGQSKTQRVSMWHHLSKFKVEDITTAIQTTWQLDGKGSKAELKYHQDTQLLIALANKPQLETVTEVLGYSSGIALAPVFCLK